MVATCRHCGANLLPENKFCANCGQPVYAAPTTKQAVYKTPQAPAPYPFTPSSRLGAAFWLGLVGAIFGLLIGSLQLVGASNTHDPLITYAQAIGVVVFSILGILGALRIIERNDTINAGLMLLAGIGMLIWIYPIGILSAFLFFIGGALILLKKG